MRASLLITVILFFSTAFAQNQGRDMGGMDMSHAAGSNSASASTGSDESMENMPGMGNGSSAEAMHSMESHHMDMGPHMRMTTLRAMQPGDQEKADQVVQAARAAMEKYKDYRVALADGYKIFLPNVKQPQYHFSNFWYTMQARNTFDPSKPPSLLYEKDGDGYRIVGVMYTAKKGATEDELNERIPLSIAQWHVHVNFCLAPWSQRGAGFQPNPKFGAAGSIATKDACDAAGGRFIPQVFGWMVHVYPLEKTQADIWSVEHHMD